jgi:hypothetical protein
VHAAHADYIMVAGKKRQRYMIGMPEKACPSRLAIVPCRDRTSTVRGLYCALRCFSLPFYVTRHAQTADGMSPYSPSACAEACPRTHSAAFLYCLCGEPVTAVVFTRACSMGSTRAWSSTSTCTGWSTHTSGGWAGGQSSRARRYGALQVDTLFLVSD